MVAVSCLYSKENTCHRQSMCELTKVSPKIFDMTNSESSESRFSQSDGKKMKKLLWCRFQQCLGPFTMLTFLGCSEIGVLRQLCNRVFRYL